MNPELLNNKFQASDNPGLDTRDPRFADIAGMVQQGNFSGAAEQAQEIIENNIYDIRIICYFLYGLFDESGPAAFTDIFNSLKTILIDNWEAIGPAKNRLKQAKKSIIWLFKQSNKILENEKNKQSDKWQNWQTDISSDIIWEAMEAANELQKETTVVFEDDSAGIIDGLSRINAWLDSFYKLIYREPEPDEPEPEETDKTDSDSIISDNSGSSTAVHPSDSAGYIQQGMHGTVSSSGSYLLYMLLKKIAVFSQLLKENKNAGAALVADDINAIIADFDPQIYFPDLFADFTKQYALNVDKLLAFQKCRDVALWKSMDKLYKVDMDSFVSINDEFHFNDPDAFNVEKSDSSDTNNDEEEDIDDDDDF